MRLITPFTFIAFFLSGISALIYELTWVRSLKYVFGSDSLALSSMLTVFIGGIALGTFISGKFIEYYFRFDADLDEKSQQSLNLGQAYSLMFSYCVVELLLGLYAFLIPFLLGPQVLGNIWSIFASYSLENALVGSLLKFLISSLFLLIPTALMGISFPLLTELLAIHNGKNFKAHQTDQFAAVNLYAVNTLGAIVGAFLGGFYLLPQFGLNNSAYLAALINIVIAVFCSLWFVLNHKSFVGANPLKVFEFVSTAAEKLNSTILKTKLAHINLNNNEKQYKQTIFILLVISFAVGFINLSLEVIWTKILTLVIGSSTYSLSIILIAVLLGISAGAYLLGLILKLADALRINHIQFLKTSLFSFAVLIFISSSLFNQLPWLFLQFRQIFGSTFESSDWLLNNVLKFGIVAIIAIPVTLVEGVIFAFVLYLISSDTNLIEAKLLEPVGTRVSRASCVNTLGAIIGSFVTGFVLIPLLGNLGSGVYYSLEVLIIVSFLLALLPYRLEPKASGRGFPWSIVTILILMCAAVFFLPQLNSQEISSGVSVYSRLNNESVKETVLFHKEGLNNIVTVVEDKAANAIFLKNNGKIEAGKPIRAEDPSKADMLTQVLLGQLPIMIKPESHTALLIGMGSGISLKSLAKAGSKVKLTKIDICEIEGQVYKAAGKFFNAPTGPDYKGVELKRHVADARNFLRALNSSSKSIANYDLIISQPSDPWISSALFTQEFWQVAANNLNDQGIFVQWLQLYSIDPEYLKITLSTFQSVFPEVLVFRPGNAAELIIVGSKSEIALDSTRIKQLIAEHDLKKELTLIGIDDEADLLSNLILVPESVRVLLGALPAPQKASKPAKYISKIDTEANEYQPKLTSLKPTENSPLVKTVKVPQYLNTDDNMLLEFHTSKKINDFYETLRKNEEVLLAKVSSRAIVKYLAEQTDPNLLTRMVRSYNQASDKLRRKMALETALELYNINPTPANTLSLYQVYQAGDEREKAESLLYEAQSKFSDIVDINRRSEVTIQEDSIEGLRLDDFQLASLAQIYQLGSRWTEAEALMKKAQELNPYDANLFVTQADIWFREIEPAIITELSVKEKTIFQGRLADIQLSYDNAIEKDNLNCGAYLGLARFYLYRASTFVESVASLVNENELENGVELETGADVKNFTNAAINNLSKALKLNPNNTEVQLTMAKIYVDMLPQSQIAFSKASTSTIDKALKYLANTLWLDPYSLEANYSMADLQYKIGNIDLAYKHSQRLNELCAKGTRCMDTLGTEKLEQANKLYEKLRKIGKGQALQKIN